MRSNNNHHHKAIIDIRLRPRCAIPPSPFEADTHPTLAIKRLYLVHATHTTPTNCVLDRLVYAVGHCIDQSVQYAIHSGVRRVGHVSLRIAPSLSGIVTPTQHTVHSAKLTHQSKRHLDRFSRFCMGPKRHAVQCIVSGEENPLKLPLRLGFRHPAGGGPSYNHRQHACIHGSEIPDISSRTDRQTDTQTCSSQYSAPGPRAK